MDLMGSSVKQPGGAAGSVRTRGSWRTQAEEPEQPEQGRGEVAEELSAHVTGNYQAQQLDAPSIGMKRDYGGKEP
jgi:hypothetical protein